MKIHALITSIILASSSAALADHVAFTNEGRPAASADMTWRMPTRLVWAPLSQMIAADHRNVIRVDDRRDDLRSLRFETGSGATYIYSVALRFDDGSREDVAVNKWLYWGVPKLDVELPRRRTGVERIEVSTWTWYRSTYRVLGQHIERAPLPMPPPPPPPPHAGLMIGKDLTFANSGGYVQLPVGAAKGTFGKLRIEATGAVTYLGRVYITFPNGAYQTLEVDKPLYRGEAVTLDLRGARNAIRTVTLMAGDDLRAVGHASSRFSVTLL